MCGVLPPGAAGGAGQRITLSLAVQVGEPGLTQSLNSGVEHHRRLLSGVAQLSRAGYRRAFGGR